MSRDRFSYITLAYVLGTGFIFVVSVILCEAGFGALKQFGLALIENFDIEMSLKNFMKINMNAEHEYMFFTISMIQVTYISRIVGNFVSEENLLDKIFMYLGNIFLSCFLSMTYELYPMKLFKSSIGFALPMYIACLALIYAVVKAILKVRGYKWGAYVYMGYLTAYLMANPIILGLMSVIVPYILGLSLYVLLYVNFLYKSKILTIVAILIISYPLNMLSGKLTDFFLEKTNGSFLPVADIVYGILSVALILVWFIFMVFKTDYTDLVFSINNQQYTYKAIKTLNRGITEDDIWWGYFKDHTLIIDGQYGYMDDYDSDTPSWYELHDEIEKIVILEGTHYIGDFAFKGLNNVKEVYISKDVREIGESPFIGCDSLEKIEVDPENEFYMSKKGKLYNRSGDEI